LKDASIDSALVFTRTKRGADQVTKVLNNAKIQAEAIHGNKSQNARQSALNNFKSKKTRVLVATDIASRGIDVTKLSHVINFEMPEESGTYIHRIGRTGRAGLSGVALSFCDNEEKHLLKSINKLINIPIPVIKEHPFNQPDKKSEAVDHSSDHPRIFKINSGKDSSHEDVSKKKKRKRRDNSRRRKSRNTWRKQRASK